jgi:hypothetical protein
MESYDREVKEKIPLPKLREKTDVMHSANNSNSVTLAEIKSMSVDELNKVGNEYLQISKRMTKKKE